MATVLSMTKIDLIKAVREYQGLGLAQAKAEVDRFVPGFSSVEEALRLQIKELKAELDVAQTQVTNLISEVGDLEDARLDDNQTLAMMGKLISHLTDADYSN